MGVPFSHEVQKASHHIDTVAPIAKIALWTIICVSIIISLLLSTLLIAVVALLITVNPDLVEERKRLVTPVLRAFLKCREWPVRISLIRAAPTREGERSKQSPTTVPEKGRG